MYKYMDVKYEDVKDIPQARKMIDSLKTQGAEELTDTQILRECIINNLELIKNSPEKIANGVVGEVVGKFDTSVIAEAMLYMGDERPDLSSYVYDMQGVDLVKKSLKDIAHGLKLSELEFMCLVLTVGWIDVVLSRCS